MTRSAEPPPRRLRLRFVLGFVLLSALTLAGFAAPFLPTELTRDLASWLGAARQYPWAPLAAIVGFVFFATAGVPQIVLITAIVAVFGPWGGLLYSWAGKLIACSIGFGLGRICGARFVGEYANQSVRRWMGELAKRGFIASALIRLVPTVPSVLINIAAGATPIRYRDFLGGTALGSVPKMALLAFGGHAAMVAVQENRLWAWLVLLAVIALWVVIAYAGKRLMLKRDAS